MTNFKKLAIRFALHGCANRPFYHLVVMKAHLGRDKKPLEQLGTFDPVPNEFGEKLVAFNYERIAHWIGRGAEPTTPVLHMLGWAGYLPLHPSTYLHAKRNRQKAAAAEEAAKLAEAAAMTPEVTEETPKPAEQ